MGNEKYLVLDTETSGLFDFSKPADADGQPRMASIAMIYLDADLNITKESLHYVRPVGWEMSEGASKINGLTTEWLLENGELVEVPLQEYCLAVDQGLIVVAFNSQYDTKILRGELRRLGIDDRFESTPNVCVMRAATNVCKIPGKYGKFKWPKLSEAAVFFGIDQTEAHTALDDTRVTVGVMKKLVEINALPEPEVHYAKKLV